MCFIKKALLVSLLAIGSLSASLVMAGTQAVSNIDAEARILSSQSKNLDPDVVKLGLTAYNNAVKKGLTNRKLLTIVDYSKPSTERRFWVLDLEHNRVLFSELVAHGRYSGDNYATSFSNNPNSHKSSLGVFVTDNTYNGKHGYSLKIDGLEKGFNDKAKARDVVVHSANYVSDSIARSTGRIGRSFGCLALDPSVSKPVINTIKDGTVIFAYYPNSTWLKESKFLVHA